MQSLLSRRAPLARALVVLALALAWLTPSSALAYTTRVHIVMANEVREALIASGDGTIRLHWSDASVRIPMADADAIIAQPLAFRAGAIGPDNMVFPGMTDGTHGVEQDPYRLCELLYQDALTEAERAYSLGCFLHGATDAVAHHYVNYFTGETFTLNPITAARGSAWTNVVGHIVTEGMIQDALVTEDASRFTAGALQHDVLTGFVQRNYFDEDAPLWLRMTVHARERWDAARAADPDASLPTLAGTVGFAPWEHIAMAPVYVREVDEQRIALRAFIVSEIADMQDMSSTRGAQLRVRPGPDAMLGTSDDETACSGGCPTIFARYYAYVRLLQPRFDAGGRELPSAYDVIADELGEDFGLLIPALVRTVANVSTALNTPVTGGEGGLDINPADVAGYFGPLRDWASDVEAINWETITRAVAPEWLVSLESFLSSFGVPIDLAGILRSIFQPVVDAVLDVVRARVIGVAEMYVSELVDQYRATFSGWESDVTARLDAGAPAGITGNTLDHIGDSGLWAYSFNITAVVLADHRVVLTGGDPIGSGAASFDASYTPRWTQIGLCDYLGMAVFPEGFDVAALLSVREGGTLRRSMASEDAPIECHDGMFDAFGAPGRESCAHSSLDELLMSSPPRGSLTRAYPPDFATGDARCARLSIPGLPEPPPEPDAGVPPGADGSVPPGVDGGPGTGPMPMSGGCACRATTASGDSGGPLALLLSILALAFASRRRRRVAPSQAARLLRTGALLALTLALVACDDPMGGTDDASTPRVDSGMDDTDASMVMGDGGMMMGDGGMMTGDGGPDPRRVLLDALGDRTWSALQTRDEGGRSLERLYQLEIRASSLEWAEIRNPFGPARRRRLRSFTVARDGGSITSTILSPDGWPVDPDNGDRETWTIRIVDGSPRELHLTPEGGTEEVFLEGAVPAPTEGLTAEVRVFSSGGPADSAFCGSGFSGFERDTFWSFARGRSAETILGHDVVAGVRLGEWRDDTGANRFAITDVEGFRDLGGTLLSTQFNFVVRYTGTVTHPGGAFAMREANDVVEDGIWAFIGDRVGSSSEADVFLEVHGFAWPDATGDEPSTTIASGEVPIEIIVARCSEQIVPVTIQARLGGGAPWRLVGDQPTSPVVSTALFPPAF